MGTKVPCPPPDYGTDCPHCTPGLWAVGQTPRIIYALCSGFETCPDNTTSNANGFLFSMVQVPVSICQWHAVYGPWTIDFWPNRFGGGKSFTQLSYSGIVHLREANGPSCPAEFTIIANPVPACVPLGQVAGGQIMIFWQLAMFPSSYGMGAVCTGPLFYEQFAHPDGGHVKKFTDLEQRTNLRVKIAP